MSHPTLESLFAVLPCYIYALVLLFAACVFYRKTCRFPFIAELSEKDNPAVGASFAGYLIGVAIALTGAFPASGAALEPALISMTYSGLLALVLMRVSILINDALVLTRFDGNVEILRDRNLGAGIAVAGASIGTGLVLAAAMTGYSESYLLAIRDIVIYWALGQALFVGGAHLFFRVAGYDVQGALELKNNTASGISVGGFFISFGILIWAASRNASGQLADELLITLLLTVCGGALLFLTRVLTQKVILPRISFAKEISLDENRAAGLISAASSIVTALLLAAAIASR